MSINSGAISLVSCGGFREGSARLIVAVGSLLLQAGSVPEAIHADGVLVADVPQELGLLRLGTPTVAVPLGRGETTATLLTKAVSLNPEFDDLRAAIAKLGIVDLNDGMGMVASLGRAAATVAIAEQRVQAHIDRDLIVPLLRLHNGTLTRASLWTMNSLAGGVGTLAGKLFAETAASRLREVTNAIIDVFAFQVGALTFLGLGDRIFNNAATGLLEHLASVFDKDRHPRESRQLLLTELPTVDGTGKEIGTDRFLRSALALSLASTFACRAVQQRVHAGRTNRTLASLCGGITLLRGQWFGLLGRDQVTAEVARNYVYELSVGGAEPPGPVLPVEVALVPVRSNLRLVGELVSAAARARNGKPPEFDGEALACVVFDCSVRSGHLLIERVIEQTLERVSSEGPMPASRELAAFTDALSANIDEAQAAETRAAVSASKSRLRLTAAIAALFPDTLTGRIEFFLSGPRRSAARFATALASYREAQSRHAEWTARRAALEAALSKAQLALKTVQALLARLQSVLTDLSAPAHPALFKCAPLPEVSAELTRCVMQGDITLLRSVLARSAREATPEGIALLVGAKNPSVAEIVARLGARPLFSAPLWGGGDPSGPPFLSAIVLPPVAPAFFTQLGEAAQQAGLRTEILTSDTLAAGATVIRLEAWDTGSIRDLFTAPYLMGLREIMNAGNVLYPLSAGARTLAASILSSDSSCAF